MDITAATFLSERDSKTRKEWQQEWYIWWWIRVEDISGNLYWVNIDIDVKYRNAYRYKYITELVSISVTQSCPTLYNAMDGSMTGLPVHHNSQSLLKLMSIESWCHPTISSSVVPFSSHLLSFPVSGSFQMSQLFTSGGRSIGVSALTSVIPMNIQDWFPLAWTDWISLQSKGLSRVFSNTTVQKYQTWVLSFLYSPTVISIHDYWKNHSVD